VTIPKAVPLPPIRVRVTYQAVWNATSVGSFVVPRDPSTLSTSWASFAGRYDQFKVNGMRVRVFLPKDGLVIGLPMGGVVPGVLTEKPTTIAFCYDNDSSGTPVSFGTIFGFDQCLALTPEGECGFGVAALPLSMVTGYTGGPGGSESTAEWIDTASPENLLGGITVCLDRLYVGLWSTTPPTTLSQVPYVIEWDCSFVARNTS
jgi:hypothetical protein